MALSVGCGWTDRLGGCPAPLETLFSWCSPREAALHPILPARLIGANPLVVAIYALGASKQMLTKHSRFIRIAPIKIIRRVPAQNAVKVVVAQERENMVKQFLLASDFDQTLSFNDSGVVLSELI